MFDPQTIALLRQLGLDAADIESLLASATILTVLMLVTAIPTAIIAGRKNRSRGWWVFFALSIPVLPLLLVWLLPALSPSEPSAKP